MSPLFDTLTDGPLTKVTVFWSNFLSMYGKRSKTLNTTISVLKQNVDFQGWNSQYACQNSKTGKILIRLLLEKQFDLGFPCLSRSMAGKQWSNFFEHSPY